MLTSDLSHKVYMHLRTARLIQFIVGQSIPLQCQLQATRSIPGAGELPHKHSTPFSDRGRRTWGSALSLRLEDILSWISVYYSLLKLRTGSKEVPM